MTYRKQLRREKISNRLKTDDGENSDGMPNENDIEENDVINGKANKNHRRAGERNGKVQSGAMSGGPRKVRLCF